MPKLLNTESELVSLDRLKLHPRNPNAGDLDSIRDSIDDNGFFGALVVQRSTRYILVGNHRYIAAKEKGFSELPVFWLDVDDERALRILLADNRTSRKGADNENVLADLLSELSLSPRALAGTGYAAGDLDEIMSRIAGADFEPVGLNEQGKLDEKAKVTCPNCNHEFTP